MVLPEIRAATTLSLLFDSGIEGGLDILRALALGADFVMMGRAWHFALGALGPAGPTHLHDILVEDMASNMEQIGARCFRQLPDCLWVIPSQMQGFTDEAMLGDDAQIRAFSLSKCTFAVFVPDNRTWSQVG